ncbi:MAG: non-homologous end-joining DNA ligase [Candidatus Eremiobacteraeota bacterium]|nr:non-homologous end-joining DNA ligase [Candidatus Eremiobacteraeota bacterium]
MLATLVAEPFDDPGWLFETKWDGVRALCTIAEGGRVSLTSRNGLDLAGQFPELAALDKAFGALPVLLDGEIASLDSDGRSSFQRLQGRLNRPDPDRRVREATPVTYVVFDLLYHGGRDLRSRPLSYRKSLLERSLRAGARSVSYSKHIVGEGRKLYELAQAYSLEGIVGKLARSAYVERRSRDWVKIKIQRRQEFVIGGWTEPRGARKLFGALLLGVYDKGRLDYVGHVGTGFGAASLEEVMRRLAPWETDRCPFGKRPSANAPCHWVQPRLVAEVKFGEWTTDGILRQPVFLGLRQDKAPSQCRRETEVR